jgi:hypothetical protein
MSVDIAYEPAGSWTRAFQLGLLAGLVPPLAAVAIVFRPEISGALRHAPVSDGLLVLLPTFFNLLVFTGLAAMPIAGLFIAIMFWIERTAPKPLLLWLLAGIIAASPLAWLAWQAGHFDFDSCSDACAPRPLWDYLWPVLLVYASGLTGAFAARRVRHGRWA